MAKWSIHFRIQNAIVWMVAAVLICILLLTLLGGAQLVRFQYESARVSQRLLLQQNELAVEAALRQVENIARSVAYNKAVQAYLTATVPAIRFELYTQVTSLLNNSLSLNDAIYDISLFDLKGNSINVNGAINETDATRALLQSSDRGIQFSISDDYAIQYTAYSTVVGALGVYPLDSSSRQRIGCVCVTLKPEELFTFPALSGVDESYNYLVLERNGRAMIGTPKALAWYAEAGNSMEALVSAEHGMVVSDVNAVYGFTFLSILDSDTALESVATILTRNYVIQACVLALIVVVTMMLVSYFLRDMKRIKTVVDDIARGDKAADKTRIEMRGSRIVSQDALELSDEINRMLDEIKTLSENVMGSYVKIHDMELANKQMEIAYLRSQVNPHFLYNTLTLICGMSSVGDTDKVIEVTQALAEIFRYSVKESAVVALADELDIVSSYLTIQSERFEDCFTVSISIQERSRNARIPAMLLQPLVENAIVHGLESVQSGGRLEIGARVDENDMLSLWVHDTGVGIDAKKLNEIKRSLADASRRGDRQRTDYIGLYNVNTRIQLYYGSEYHLDIESVENLGTRVSMRIPFREQLEPAAFDAAEGSEA